MNKSMNITTEILNEPQCRFKFLNRLGFYTPVFYNKMNNYSDLINLTSSERFENKNLEISGWLQEINKWESSQKISKIFLKKDFIQTSTIENLKWVVNSSGHIKPVIYFNQPIKNIEDDSLMYSCSLDSLNYYKILTKNNKSSISKNDKVYIMFKEKNKPFCIHIQPINKTYDFHIPTICPSCSNNLKFSDFELYCDNTDCQVKQLEIFKIYSEFISINDDVVLKFIEDKNIQTLYDFITFDFDLQIDDEKTLHNAISKHNTIDLNLFLNLINGSKINDSAFYIFKDNFETIIKNNNGVEIILNKEPFTLLDNKSKENLINILTKYKTEYLKYSSVLNIIINENTIKNKSFCFTNTMIIDKKNYENQILKLGGTIDKNIKQTTDYLITNENKLKKSSSKLNKALDYNSKMYNKGMIKEIKILNEEQLKKLLKGVS